jgi:predicted flap endonuclease-1-like 5' DNA nuclease
MAPVLALPKRKAREKLMELPGIGPKTAEILKSLGLETIGQIVQARPDELAFRLGKPKG